MGPWPQRGRLLAVNLLSHVRQGKLGASEMEIDIGRARSHKGLSLMRTRPQHIRKRLSRAFSLLLSVQATSRMVPARRRKMGSRQASSRADAENKRTARDARHSSQMRPTLGTGGQRDRGSPGPMLQACPESHRPASDACRFVGNHAFRRTLCIIGRSSL